MSDRGIRLLAGAATAAEFEQDAFFYAFCRCTRGIGVCRVPFHADRRAGDSDGSCGVEQDGRLRPCQRA